MAKTISQITEKKPLSGWKIFLIVLASIFGAFCLFIFIIISLIFSGSSETDSTGNVALIPLNGEITTATSGGFMSNDVSTSSQLVKWIGEAEKDDSIKAIVIEINSPGGSPVATDEIVREIKKSTKPTIAVIREVGASGAYWVASSCDKIYANRMSITGSIGVIGSYVEVEGLLNKYNMTYRRLVAGKFKDIGSPLTTMTTEEQNLYQGMLDKLHSYFIEDVATNRNLSVEKVTEIATGWVYLGEDAKDLGLIDEVGNLDDAKAYLEETLNTTVTFKTYQKPSSFLELLSGSAETSINNFGMSIGQGLGNSIKSEDKYNIKFE